MTKLEELKAAYDDAEDAVYDAYDEADDDEDPALIAARDVAGDAWDAYKAELKKTKENSDD